MKLSLIVITKNNQDVLPACLKSARLLADEIIVIDDFSTDKTASLARKSGAKIYAHKLTTFAAQRNFGAKKASAAWLMFLDADETISVQLAREIKKTIKLTSHSAFRLRRQNYFLGRLMRHSGYWPDWQTRLFLSNDFKGVFGATHEDYRFKGTLGSLTHPLIHRPNRRVSFGLRKSILWTGLEAQALFASGHPPVTGLRLIKVMVAEFFYRYIKLTGWRDGYVGLVEAVTQATNKFFIYQQLWELQHEDRSL